MINIVVGMSGASGVIYGIRLLEALRQVPEVRSHLVMSRWAQETLVVETDYSLEAVEVLADAVYRDHNLGAAIASGSFRTDAMVIVPCSMKTLAAIASGLADNLVSRAADVALKEGRKLILCPRETPLSAIHLENMLKLARLGVRIVPPMPGFYRRPQTVEDIIAHTVMKLMDQLNLPYDKAARWPG